MLAEPFESSLELGEALMESFAIYCQVLFA